MKTLHQTIQASVLIGLLLLPLACPGGEGPQELPLAYGKGCQPLYDGADCFLPYPSDFFLRKSALTPSGFEIFHEGEGKLLTKEEYSADVNDWKAADGFSLHSPIIFMLDARVSLSNCVGILDDKTQSLSKDHCTLIIDETGQAVAHFVDVDARAEADGKQMIILRPLSGLNPQSTYVVAVQGLKDLNGKWVDAPLGFKALRDDHIDNAELAAQRSLYETDIFPLLTDFGLAREDLQLAWRFTTGSREWATTDMLQSRALVLEWLKTHTPHIEIEAVLEETSGASAISVYGKMTGPLVMENPAPGALIARDTEGKVRLNGDVTFPFVATIPKSIIESGVAGFPLMFGHGFFGERTEAETGTVRNIGQELSAVVFAVDWQGMSLHDMGPVVSNLGNEAAYALQFTDRVTQGVVNHLVMGHAIKNQMSSLEAFQFSDGTPLYDPENLNYLGISMGHILGGLLAGLSPDIGGYCLNVGGAVFTHIMSRAIPFAPFLAILDVSVPDPFIQQKLIATLQPIFDRIDPAMWAPYVLSMPLPDETEVTPRHVLMQIGIGDTAVPNFSSYQHARLLGLDMLSPSPASPYGLPAVQESLENPMTSGLTIFDYGIDDSFYHEAKASDVATPAHEAVRRTPEALEQLKVFFTEGRIIHPCEGPCELNVP